MKREVIRASVLGYCMGVRRAVSVAMKCLDTYKEHPVYSFGPLIHNRSALAVLEEKGLGLLENDGAGLSDGCVLSASGKGTEPVVIIRAHGIPPETRAALEKKGCIIEDATCPRVLANQKKAASYAAKGYTVIIAGDKNHGEVTGLAGCVHTAAAVCQAETQDTDGSRACDASEKRAVCLLVESPSDAASLDVTQCGADTVLISQTTISPAEYAEIAAVLRSRIPALEVLDTVCPATQERQAALDELCERADGVLIIGGKNSANTQRLFTSAQKKCAHVAHIETADDIPDEFFTLPVVGITAGASTPDFVIDAVEARLKNEIR